MSATSATEIPNSDALRPLLKQYFDNNADTTALRDALHSTFCSFAEQAVPVERALALVNGAIDATAGLALARRAPLAEPLKRLVMQCCLECYFPSPSGMVGDPAHA